MNPLDASLIFTILVSIPKTHVVCDTETVCSITVMWSPISRKWFLNHSDAVFVCLAVFLARFTGIFVIYSVLGHVAYRSGLDISDFQQSGIEALFGCHI
ncbi:hypothetical protein DPMN_047776 [Dreissena polymorpha]|uniref:Uncharacterized protein n=1 Tax=Dreissena polymorpha TaxID=45954 RepID=A0A9D4D8N1_DREPO|nr:hypothetical protein DPMN_047776 [Dreissena polymorpha]